MLCCAKRRTVGRASNRRSGRDPQVAEAFLDALIGGKVGSIRLAPVRRHRDGDALPVIIVQTSLLLGQTILIESGLSYLGPAPSPRSRAGGTWWSTGGSSSPPPGGSRPSRSWRFFATV